MISQRSLHTVTVPSASPPAEPLGPQLTPGLILSFLSARGLSEHPLIHTQDYDDFLREKGVTELGRGGEGAVYFLRGHVVKLVGVDFTPALLREIAHMLHLNPVTKAGADGKDVVAMGERQRSDVPSLLWIYTLSNGGLSVGMRPFDHSESGPRGSTLHDRLYAGPMMPREQALKAILSISSTLVYIQKKGVIHHDLKPANIYIPGDPNAKPVVFDLGQALWRRMAWGDQWLMNNHNLQYWYNGTYQYMHRHRRAAHMCALSISGGIPCTDVLRQAFQSFVPKEYDDVFSFAYIVRNLVNSPFTKLLSIDKRLLTDYYRSLMMLQRTQPKPTRLLKSTGIFGRVKGLFSKDPTPPPGTNPAIRKKPDVVERMEQAHARLDEVIKKLLTIPST